MTTVITYGTFDLFHIGHVRLLRRLGGLGSRLIVGCSTDEFNALKGKKAVFSYRERAEILSSCSYVDEVFPEECWEQKVEDIKKYKVDIFAMGDDWSGKFDYLEKDVGCIVTYIPRTHDVSTTEVKAAINSFQKDKVQDLMRLAEQLRSRLGALLDA